MAKLWKRGKVWCIVWTESPKKKGGRRVNRRISTGTSDKALAKKLFAEWLEKNGQRLAEEKSRALLGLPVGPSTLPDLWAAYQVSWGRVDMRQNTKDSYARSVRQFDEFIGGRDLFEVTPGDVEAFLYFRRVDQGLPAAANTDLAQLRAIMNWGVRHTPPLCPDGLFDGLRAQTAAPKRTPRVIGDEEITALFEVAKEIDAERDHRMFVWLSLAFYHGFRPLECCSLMVSSIDKNLRAIAVRDVEEMDFRVKGNAERFVKLAPVTYDLVGEIEPMPGGLFLTGYRSTSSAPFQAEWRRMVKQAGVKNLEPKDFRKNFAYRFLQLKGDESLTRAMMGHTQDSEMLTKHYVNTGDFLKHNPSIIFNNGWSEDFIKT